MKNRDLKVVIKYNDDASSWNNVTSNLISFLIESDEFKRILCKE